MRRILAIIGAAALLAGCAAPVVTTPSTPITPADIPAGAVASAAAPAAIPATLRFTGKTLDGASFDAGKMAGKPTILWFWAPWCATCASEAQSITDLADEYQGRLSILGIAGLGTNKAMHQFVSDLNVGNVPHLDDQAGAIWKKFKITQQSTYVFLDRTGQVVKTGYLDDLQLTAEVKSLVA
nr:redoxin domain-containing protein [Actinoplanes subtropicus]